MSQPAAKVKQMSVHRYPDLIPGENGELSTGDQEHFLLREVQYDSTGNIITDIEYDETGEEMERFENTTDENGRITEHKHYSSGELVERITISYDAAGRIVKESKHYDEGEPADTIYVYDDKGQLLEKRSESSPGEAEHRDVYEYHPEGLEKVTQYEEYGFGNKLIRREKNSYELREGELVMTETFHENMETGKKYKVVHENAKTHDDNVSNIVYDENDRIAEIVREWFDERGNPLKLAHKTRIASSDTIIEYAYDDRDNMIFRKQDLGSGQFRESRFFYNEHNLLGWQYTNFGQASTLADALFTDVFTYELHS